MDILLGISECWMPEQFQLLQIHLLEGGMEIN
jgi:hypothetical protein